LKYLVDANVLSEVTRPEPQRQVVDWLQANEQELAVDPIVIGEIRYGILLLPSGKRRRRLETWFDSGVRRIHCLEWAADHGVRWAALLADLKKRGQVMPVKDSLIATSAIIHDLTVVTRNVADFDRARVRTLDPFM